MIRDLLMQAIPFEVRAHHGRFVTPNERSLSDNLRERGLVRKIYAAVQGKR